MSSVGAWPRYTSRPDARGGGEAHSAALTMATGIPFNAMAD